MERYLKKEHTPKVSKNTEYEELAEVVATYLR